jgi:hypothetical protein
MTLHQPKIIGDNIGQAKAAADVLAPLLLRSMSKLRPCAPLRLKSAARAVHAQIAAAVYDAMPAHLNAGTKNNYLSAIRAAVNGKADFQFPNGSAKAKAAKAKAKAKGAKAGGGTIMIAISSGAKAKDAAAKLRAGFNKMKDSGDELAKLAAFLIDALDDAGHAAESE